MEIKIFEPGYNKKEFYGYMGDALTMPEIKKELPYISNSHEMIWFLAFDGEKLIGFAAVEPKGKCITLRNQYVYQDHRKNGVFRKLLNSSLEYAAKFNLPVSVAIVADQKLISVYQKLGFVETRKTKNYVFLKREPKT